MPDGDALDGFSYPTLTPMIESYNTACQTTETIHTFEMMNITSLATQECIMSVRVG